MRLSIVTSHPIQYQAPLFRALAQRVDLHVYFAHRATEQDQAQAEFGVPFQWDVDLTSGYSHSYLVNISKTPGITRYGGCDTPDIGKEIAKRPCDVMLIHGWHFKSYLQAAKAARNLGLPLMVRTDSHLDEPRPLGKRMAKSLIYPFFFRRFNMFLASGTQAAAYLQHYRVPESRIRIVPYCIDVEAFRSNAEESRGSRRKKMRANWGVTSAETVVLFVGKLIERKRVKDLLDAVEMLVRAGHSTRLVIVGTGPLEAELRRQASHLRIPTVFAGFVNQSHLPEIYAAVELLVLPSDNESWGMVVNEAFACGLPAIVSDRVGCAPDMIREGLTGCVFPMGDSQRLADTIRKFAGMVRDHAVIQALAEVSERYSPRRSAEAIVGAAEICLKDAKTHKR